MAKKVALFCGHGTQTNGVWDAGCSYGGYTEAGLMLKITKSAVKYLRAKGVTVITDADANNNINMIKQVARANKEKCDIFVSVHCDYSKAPSGVLPLYYSSAGKKLATKLNTTISKGMPMKSRGVMKRTDLYELKATSMPAVILETGAIKADLKILKGNYDKYGKLIAQAICAYLGVKTSTTPYKPTTAYTGKLPSKTIKKGSKGTQVKYLQSFLNWALGTKLSKDGVAGSKTVSAIKKFQKQYGLKADGVFGSKSLAKAKSIVEAHKPKPAPTLAKVPTPAKTTTADKIVKLAKEYAWAYGTKSSKYGYAKGYAKAVYKSALKKQMKKTAKVSQSDCGYFVNTVIRAAGLGKFTALGKNGRTPYPKLVGKLKIVHKGKKIPSGFLKKGDVIRYQKKNGHQHTLLYIGNGKCAEAGRSHYFPRITKDIKKYNNTKSVKASTIQVLRAK